MSNRDTAHVGRRIATRASTADYRPVGSVQECRLRFLDWAQSKGLNTSVQDATISWRFRGQFDSTLMAKAIQRVWERHDALTATYHRLGFGDAPAQVLRRDSPPVVITTELEEGGTVQSRVRAARTMLEGVSGKRMPLEKAPQLAARLVRVDPTDHVMAVFCPSLMMDHWSYGVFTRDLATHYNALLAGVPPDIDECGQFSEYAQEEFQSLRDGTWSDSVEFWQDHYNGESPLPVLSLPPLGGRSAAGLAGGSVRGTFNRETVAVLRAAWAGLSRHRITPYVFMLTAVITLLYRLTGSADLGVLVPAANRTRWEYQDTVGLFATILAPRFRSVGDQAFGTLCELVRDRMIASMDHQHVGYHDMKRRLDPARYGQPHYAPSCYFDYWIDDHDELATSFGGIQPEGFLLNKPPKEEEGIALVFRDDGAMGITFSISFARRVFSMEVARMLVRDLETIALNAAAELHASVSTLSNCTGLESPRATGEHRRCAK